MSKKILGLVTVFAVIMIMSLSSFAISISHQLTNTREKCSVTVSGSDTYNTVVKTRVYSGGIVVDADTNTRSDLNNDTLSVSSYCVHPTKGYWYAHSSSNQHSNITVTQEGYDT